MSHTPHELNDEFPQSIEKIHQLKQSNPHFAKLAKSHHQLNRDIHRMETDVEPVSDHTLENLKKQRLALLDEISTLIAD